MNEKLTLQDIINLLCEKQGINRKEAELFVRTMFGLIKESLDKEKYIKIKGLGTFKLTEVNSRESVDVNTGERIEIQGHSRVSFTPDATMKDLINKPFAHFETVVLNDGVELEDTPVETPEEPMAQEEVIVASVQIIEEVPAVIEEPVAEPMTEEPIAQESAEETVVMEAAAVEEQPVEEVVEDAPEETGGEAEVLEAELEKPVEDTPMEELQPEIIEAREEPEEKPESIEEKAIEERIVREVEKERNINRILWGVIVVLVLIILFGAYWMFFRSEDVPEPVPASPVQEEIVTPAPEEVKPQEETQKTVQFIELSEEELRKERVPSLADTLDCEIVGTQEEYTLQKGETIIRVSVRFFGTKKYWPYLVKHNTDVLPDPDNIPVGIRIKIPKLVEKNK